MQCSQRTLSCFWLELLGGNALAEITDQRGSPLEQESKSVGCLLRWLWMFSASAFYGSQSVALKGEDVLFFLCFVLLFYSFSAVVFVLTEVRCRIHLQFMSHSVPFSPVTVLTLIIIIILCTWHFYTSFFVIVFYFLVSFFFSNFFNKYQIVQTKIESGHHATTTHWGRFFNSQLLVLTFLDFFFSLSGLINTAFLLCVGWTVVYLAVFSLHMKRQA